MGSPATVDTGQIIPVTLYAGEPANAAAATVTANTVYYVYLPPLTANATLTNVRARCGAGGNGHYDVGIYDATGTNGQPGNLLAHAASTNTSLATASGILTPSLVGGNLLLSPGNYWLAFWIDNATDTVSKNAAAASGMMACMQQSSSGPLPATASGLSNSLQRIFLDGLILNGWS